MRQDSVTISGHRRKVFNTEATETATIEARFDGHHVANLDHVI